MTRAMRTNSRVWVKVIRPFILARDPWCVGYPAGYHGSTLVRTNSVDHIRAQSMGGTEDLSNLRGVCGSCNSRKAMAEEGARSWQ